MGRRPKGSPPAYLPHKGTGQAYSHVNGHRVYLGVYGTAASHAAHAALVADYLAGQRGEALPARKGCTAVQLWEQFRGHALTHYRRPDGTPTGEADAFRLSLAPLLARFGRLPADSFRAPQLDAVRDDLIAAGLCRKVVNQRVGRVRRVWRWGVSRDLVDPATLTSLEALPDLQEGRTAAPDHEEVGPVDVAVAEATLPHLASDQLRAMVRLQLWAGMRPGEVCAMRSGDVVRDGVLRVGKRVVTVRPPSWVYVLRAKMAHARAQKLQGYVLGPRCRGLLTPWLRADPAAYLFQPREAHPARAGKGRRRPGERYTTSSYGHAVRNAVLRANARPGAVPLPHWHPHQLRHHVAGLIDLEEGIEAAGNVLGHANPNTTLIYLKRNLDAAAAIMERLG